MEAGVVRFKLVDHPSEKKAEFFEFNAKTGRSSTRFGKSPLELQTQFLKQLHADGYEPYDMKDGYQYWRRAPKPSTVAG